MGKKSKAPAIQASPALERRIGSLESLLTSERQSRESTESSWRNREAEWQSREMGYVQAVAKNDALAQSLRSSNAALSATTAALTSQSATRSAEQAPASDVPVTELDSASVDAMEAVRRRVRGQKARTTRSALLIPMSGTSGGGLSIPS